MEVLEKGTLITEQQTANSKQQTASSCRKVYMESDEYKLRIF